MFFNSFDEEVRKVFFKDKDKYLVMSWIIFKTNYQEDYNGLNIKECYFSYSVVEMDLSLSHKKLIRIMKELEEDRFISWVFKSKTRHKQSVLNLLNEGTSKGTDKGTSKGTSKVVENTTLTEKKEPVKELIKEPVKGLSSKNISKNISNICPSDKKVVDIKTKKDKKINKDKKDLEVSEMFEKLWSIYPRKEGKGQARNHFKKLASEYSFEELERTVTRYKNKCIKDKTEQQFIKMGSTFFKTGFEDYLDRNFIEQELPKRKKYTYTGF